MSQLYNGTQDYSPKIIGEASRALNIEDWELLMPPSRAKGFRRLVNSAEDIVEIKRLEGRLEAELPDEADDHRARA